MTAILAADWVARQISHDALVACDQAMCGVLAAHGFPGRHLRVFRPGSRLPRHAQVVVVTPALRHQAAGSQGTDPRTNRAPAVLARFGIGGQAISVRAVAPHGADAYWAALRSDRRQRRIGGAGLLANPQVTTSAAARGQLLAGLVDARLIVVLTALAAVHPVHVLAFGTTFAETSANIPLRAADLAEYDAAAGLARPRYHRFLLRQLAIQPGVYRPAFAGLARDTAGMRIIRIRFGAPSPLGLLGGQAP